MSRIAFSLLDNSLKHYKHPVIVLDALDECPEEACGMIMEDLYSIGHSLDIGDALRVQNKKLLQGKISLELKQLIKDVLSRCTWNVRGLPFLELLCSQSPSSHPAGLSDHWTDPCYSLYFTYR